MGKESAVRFECVRVMVMTFPGLGPNAMNNHLMMMEAQGAKTQCNGLPHGPALNDKRGSLLKAIIEPRVEASAGLLFDSNPTRGAHSTVARDEDLVRHNKRTALEVRHAALLVTLGVRLKYPWVAFISAEAQDSTQRGTRL
eukprot:5954394-Amphidinium_carterae.1